MPEYIVKITYENDQGAKYSYSTTLEADTPEQARSAAELEAIVIDHPEHLKVWVYPVTGR